MAKVSKKQYLIEDTVIIDQIYPLVEATMSSKCSALKIEFSLRRVTLMISLRVLM